MTPNNKSRAALRLANVAFELLEKHSRSPERAVDDLMQITRAEGGPMDDLMPPAELKAQALIYLQRMAENMKQSAAKN